MEFPMIYFLMSKSYLFFKVAEIPFFLKLSIAILPPNSNFHIWHQHIFVLASLFDV